MMVSFLFYVGTSKYSPYTIAQIRATIKMQFANKNPVSIRKRDFL